MKIYSGIGSRETPANILLLMNQLAKELESMGFMVRSGGAYGADAAFTNNISNRCIYLPWDKYNGYKINDIDIMLGHSIYTEEIASKYHPAWHNCSQGARKLHARNVSIMFGWLLDNPSDFVICWTKDGKDSGGTGQAMRIAIDNNIPIFNLYFPDAVEKLSQFIKEKYL